MYTTFKLHGNWYHLNSLKLTMKRVVYITEIHMLQMQIRTPHPQDSDVKHLSAHHWYCICLSGELYGGTKHLHKIISHVWTLSKDFSHVSLIFDVICIRDPLTSFLKLVFLSFSPRGGYLDMSSISSGSCLGGNFWLCNSPFLIFQTDPLCVLTVFFHPK